jgi:SAM-dependent methyltransferase
MPLPDVSRLADLDASTWRKLADRLRAVSINASTVHFVAHVAERALDPLRRALRSYHLAKIRNPTGYAMRLFIFRDAVDDGEARAALGDAVTIEQLLAAGLIAREADGRLRSPFYMNLVNELYVLCDDLTEGDGVMGLGHTTGDLCAASLPTQEVGSVLEVGCGAATGLLLCASRARRAVGIDIDPRAIVVARANALLNGIENVEFRQGDLFAPVAGEEFDLILAQPPFVAQPPGDSAITWMHGGARGDELPLRFLRELPAHLAPGGRGVVLVEWPVFDREGEPPLEARVREVVPRDDIGVLLVSSAGTDLDEHCIGYATGRPPFAGPEVERRMVARRAHLDAMGVRELRLTVNVLQRTSPGRAWTTRVDARSFGKVSVTSPRIDKLVAAEELLASGRASLAAARLRLPHGARFVESERGVLIELPDEALIPPLRVSPHAARLVSVFATPKTVRDAAAEFAPDMDDALADKLFGAVEQALSSGALEVDLGAKSASPPS